MRKIIIKEVYPIPFYPEGVDHCWSTLEYTSGNPYEWGGEDVEHIIEVLMRGIGKYPILTVDYLGNMTPTKSLEFRVSYEIKIPRTTLHCNRETIRACVLMECL